MGLEAFFRNYGCVIAQIEIKHLSYFKATRRGENPPSSGISNAEARLPLKEDRFSESDLSRRGTRIPSVCSKSRTSGGAKDFDRNDVRWDSDYMYSLSAMSLHLWEERTFHRPVLGLLSTCHISVQFSTWAALGGAQGSLSGLCQWRQWNHGARLSRLPDEQQQRPFCGREKRAFPDGARHGELLSGSGDPGRGQCLLLWEVQLPPARWENHESGVSARIPNPHPAAVLLQCQVPRSEEDSGKCHHSAADETSRISPFTEFGNFIFRISAWACRLSRELWKSGQEAQAIPKRRARWKEEDGAVGSRRRVGPAGAVCSQFSGGAFRRVLRERTLLLVRPQHRRGRRDSAFSQSVPLQWRCAERSGSV